MSDVIAYVLAILLGVSIGIVISNAADWLLPEEIDKEDGE